MSVRVDAGAQVQPAHVLGLTARSTSWYVVLLSRSRPWKWLNRLSRLLLVRGWFRWIWCHPLGSGANKIRSALPGAIATDQVSTDYVPKAWFAHLLL